MIKVRENDVTILKYKSCSAQISDYKRNPLAAEDDTSSISWIAVCKIDDTFDDSELSEPMYVISECSTHKYVSFRTQKTREELLNTKGILYV